MKEITIDGRTFLVQPMRYVDAWDRTHFYYGTYTKTTKTWFGFGKPKIEQVPRYAFTIDKLITDPEITKEWWNKEIREKIVILERREEIEKGELI